MVERTIEISVRESKKQTLGKLGAEHLGNVGRFSSVGAKIASDSRTRVAFIPAISAASLRTVHILSLKDEGNVME